MARTVKVNGTEASEAVKGFEPILPGKYIAKIVDVKEGVFKSEANKGTEKYAVRFKIIEGPEGIGRQFTDFNIPLVSKWGSGKAAGQFYEFFGAVGVQCPEKGSDAEIEIPEPEELLGEEIGIVLKTEKKYNDPNATESKVDSFGYFEASEGLPDVETGSDEFTL
jgi:hypothetical protein